MLGVSLLEIAQAADQLFAGNVLVVGEEVLLGSLAGVVDEDVGVGGHACYCANHVATRAWLVMVDEEQDEEQDEEEGEGVLVQGVELLCRSVLFE